MSLDELNFIKSLNLESGEGYYGCPEEGRKMPMPPYSLPTTDCSTGAVFDVWHGCFSATRVVLLAFVAIAGSM